MAPTLEDMEAICDLATYPTGRWLEGIPQRALFRFIAIHDRAFTDRTTAADGEYLADFERRLLRLRAGGAWSVPSEYRQLELLEGGR